MKRRATTAEMDDQREDAPPPAPPLALPPATTEAHGSHLAGINAPTAPLSQPTSAAAAVGTVPNLALHERSRRDQFRSRFQRNAQLARTSDNKFKCARRGCNDVFSKEVDWE
jgi:hypothetical protein